jgi:GT2 family glycosyltransferase
LSRCLDALEAQTVADQLEVVVVDDGSIAPRAVAEALNGHARMRLIRERGGGPAAARNAGVRAARGSLLCFTDDDCEPHADWVERMVEALEAGTDAAAGTTISAGGVLTEASEITAHAPTRASTPEGTDLPFAPSNNLACTRAVLEAVPFDETYPFAAGEDRDWCARLLSAGFTLRSQPAAQVVHHQALTLGRFLRQQARYGEGAYRFRRLGDVHRPLEPLTFYAALIRHAFAQRFVVGILVCMAQAATALGFARAWAIERRNGSVTRPASSSVSEVHEPQQRSESPPPT